MAYDAFDPWDEQTDPAMSPAPAPQPAFNEWGLPPNSGNQAGYMDLSYWISRGVTPDQIFDENGQTKPGWARTARGYEMTGGGGGSTGPATGGDYTPPGGYGGTSGGEAGGYQAPARRTLGSLNYPSFQGPTFSAPEPFAYKDYQLPTQAEIAAEPGFDFALTQGLKAYENSKAYLGTYKTGATIKGLNDYARGAATQNADRVIGRSMENYDRNRNNAADSYATNYGISRDVFDRNYTAAKDAYAPQARARELEFARDWDVYAYEGDDDYRRWKARIDANS